MTTKEQLHELVDELPDEEAGMILAYLRHVLASVSEDEDDLSPELLTRLAAAGGAFDWLDDEPELYTLEDGIPIEP